MLQTRSVYTAGMCGATAALPSSNHLNTRAHLHYQLQLSLLLQQVYHTQLIALIAVVECTLRRESAAVIMWSATSSSKCTQRQALYISPSIAWRARLCSMPKASGSGFWLCGLDRWHACAGSQILTYLENRKINGLAEPRLLFTLLHLHALRLVMAGCDQRIMAPGRACGELTCRG